MPRAYNEDVILPLRQPVKRIVIPERRLEMHVVE